jgi:hypothetical protein
VSLTAVVGIKTFGLGHASAVTAVPASTAGSFIDSLGVNVHMGYSRYAWTGEV